MDEKKLNTAIKHHQDGDISKALSLYTELLLENKKSPQLLFLIGTANLEMKTYETAIEFLKESIAIYPENPVSYYNLGLAYQEINLLIRAISSYKKAINLNDNYTEAHINIGSVFLKLKRYNEAVNSFDQALMLSNNDPEIYSNRGHALVGLKRYDEALKGYDQALALNPKEAKIYLNFGYLFHSLRRFRDAIFYFKKALILKPNYTEAYIGLGDCHINLKDYQEGVHNYNQIFEFKVWVDNFLGLFIHTKMQICDWGNYCLLLKKIINKIRKKEKASVPFFVLSLSDDPSLQKESAEIFVHDQHSVTNLLPEINRYSSHKKIRIGYFSADFYNHATMHLLADVFEYHNNDQYELYGFSFQDAENDEWTEIVKEKFNKFFDVSKKSDEEIALMARNIQIDIAIDLKGYTAHSRPDIFSYRTAGIQVSYLGYPGTMGTKCIDYIIADKTLIPKNMQQYYSEKIIYLPNSYQANMAERAISQKEFQRKEMGLPDDAFVFASFNNSWKITPETFDSWMRILLSAKGSVLWLLSTNSIQIKNLSNEAELRGVNGNRLIFASFLPIEEHLKRIQLADLFLDTFPYNAHTTASDSLRMGLPLITRSGNSFASRVAASLLNAIDLPELITTTKEEFELLAIDLANNHDKLLQIKNRLLNNLSVSPLFNSKLFTQHLETAYKTIYKRYLDDLPPDHIYISN
jgi:predicted O-linked N-acetylglucosamine transferase (SPINDLY family)